MDLTSKGMTGKAAEVCLDKAGITVNKNLIPFDKEKPFVTSGVRIGTPAATTRGMKEKEMEKVADFMDRAIQSCDDDKKLSLIREEVREFLKDFPLYKDWLSEMKELDKK